MISHRDWHALSSRHPTLASSIGRAEVWQGWFLLNQDTEIARTSLYLCIYIYFPARLSGNHWHFHWHRLNRCQPECTAVVDGAGILPHWITPPAKSCWWNGWIRMGNEINILFDFAMLIAESTRGPPLLYVPAISGWDGDPYGMVWSCAFARLKLRVNHQWVLWRPRFPYLANSKLSLAPIRAWPGSMPVDRRLRPFQT